MAQSSILGGQRPAEQASGRNTGALGPSDSSDSSSDVQGERPSIDTTDPELRESAVTADLDSDSDSAGTGERSAAVPDGARENADIATDSERDVLDIAEDDDEDTATDPDTSTPAPTRRPKDSR